MVIQHGIGEKVDVLRVLKLHCAKHCKTLQSSAMRVLKVFSRVSQYHSLVSLLNHGKRNLFQLRFKLRSPRLARECSTCEPVT